MKKNLLLGILALFSMQFCYALNAAHIQTGIEEILHKFDPNINIGIQIVSLSKGEIVYQKNANQLFLPASTLKIFPAAAALSYLGLDYRFTTKILAKTTAVQQGTLNSDVYIHFDGDPVLTRNELGNLIATIKQFNIQTIHGNIYIDDAAFDQEIYGPGWTWEERNFCYAAPTSAITIDRNCFPFQLTANRQAGHLATTSISPEYNFIQLANAVITRHVSYDDCPIDLHATNNNVYSLTGCIHPNTPTMNLLIAIRNIRLFTKEILARELQKQNIQLSGEIRFGKTPTDIPLSIFAQHQSDPLYLLVRKMLKKSDNLIADALYKKIGNTYWNKSATWKNSAKAIAAILGKNTGINFNKLRIFDGSGLSRFNLVSPAQLVAVLRYAYRDHAVQQGFFTALPNAGVDGTMAYRLTKYRGRVHAKTGNMQSVSSLAGYIETNSGEVLAFAIIINSFLSKPVKYHKLQDLICGFLARN